MPMAHVRPAAAARLSAYAPSGCLCMFRCWHAAFRWRRRPPQLAIIERRRASGFRGGACIGACRCMGARGLGLGVTAARSIWVWPFGSETGPGGMARWATGMGMVSPPEAAASCMCNGEGRTGIWQPACAPGTPTQTTDPQMPYMPVYNRPGHGRQWARPAPRGIAHRPQSVQILYRSMRKIQHEGMYCYWICCPRS